MARAKTPRPRTKQSRAVELGVEALGLVTEDRAALEARLNPALIERLTDVGVPFSRARSRPVERPDRAGHEVSPQRSRAAEPRLGLCNSPPPPRRRAQRPPTRRLGPPRTSRASAGAPRPDAR